MSHICKTCIEMLLEVPKFVWTIKRGPAASREALLWCLGHPGDAKVALVTHILQDIDIDMDMRNL